VFWGVAVPIPTSPFKAVVKILSFPKTTVFAPIPIALFPMTIELLSLLFFPFELYPI